MMIRLTFGISLCLTLASGQLYDRLFHDLVSGYNKYTLPVRSNNETVNATMSMSLIQVNSLSPETGDIELEMWLIFRWIDFRLRWSHTAYNNIYSLSVPFSKLWSPDIVPYNGHMIDQKEYNAILKNDGTIIKIPPVTIKSRCDVTSYDRDGTVTCNLKFGSWTYDGFKIDIHLESEGVDVSSYNLGRWEVISNTGRRNVMHYLCCPEPYIDVTFTLVFRNKLASRGWSFFD